MLQPQVGKRVLDPHRWLVPGDQPVLLERAEGLCEGLLRHLTDLVEELAVTATAPRQEVEHADAPLAGQQVEHRLRAANHLDVGRLRWPGHAAASSAIG